MSGSADTERNAAGEVQALREQIDLLWRQIERFHVVQQISQELVSELDQERLLRTIVRSAAEMMEAQAGSLLLLDEKADELVFQVVEGGGGARLQGKRMSRNQGIGGWVLNHQEAVIVDDVIQDDRYNAEIGASVDYATTSMICAPMVDRGEAIGVLEILNKRDGKRFDETDKELLTVLAAQSAIAIRNARLYQELREERDRLVALEEDVRKRLARDLHDGPTQLVAAIMMDLQFVGKLLKQEPDKADAELRETSALAERAMRQLRTMLFDLRPVILETKGLVPALEAYSSRLTETERFTVCLDVEGEVPELTKRAESAIFAVVQEAISNARKHTHAGNMWITVRCQNGTLAVTVRDNGEGFDVNKMWADYDSRGSMGMINMRERADMIQAALTIESVVGEGTIVHLEVPLRPNLQT
jgi:signal transduction histidine kinase